MLGDAVFAGIKAIEPSAKVVSVETLPWWQSAPLDPERAHLRKLRKSERWIAP